MPDQKRIYGVARHEDAHVICKVEAYPAPQNFQWTFNNTEEMVDVPKARFENSTRHTQSMLTYRPVTEMDYGTVLCWATNAAGKQKNACIFHIIPAGTYVVVYRPDRVESLRISGKSSGQRFCKHAYRSRFAMLRRNNVVRC